MSAKHTCATEGQIDRPAVFVIRDKTLKLRTRRFANYCVQLLSLTMAWTIPRGEAQGLVGNPAADIPQFRRLSA